MEFTLESYSLLVDELRMQGYEFVDYHNYKQYDKVVILRHDIDLSIEKALDIAHLEYNLNIKSNYFVLIASDFYNVFSKKNEAYLKEICNLGHNVGLHFDEAKYNSNENLLVSNMKKEIDILEKCLDRKVTSISMHRPSKKTLNANYKINLPVGGGGK